MIPIQILLPPCQPTKTTKESLIATTLFKPNLCQELIPKHKEENHEMNQYQVIQIPKSHPIFDQDPIAPFHYIHHPIIPFCK